MPPIDRRTFVVETAAALSLAKLAHAAPRRQAMGPVYAEVERRIPEATQRLQEWIRQPSVNSQGIGMKEGAELMAKLARDAGFQQVELVPTSGASAVFGRLDAGAKHTLALYFMYDVKQVEEKEWSHPPFAAELVDLPEFGKVVMGRGAVNQKGPQAALLGALHAIRGAGRKPPVNLVLIAEGEEEDGSPHFGEAVGRADVQQALSGCRGIMMPSAEQNSDGTVEISLGCKGVVEVELVASGAKWGRGPRDRDIHSSGKAAIDSPVWHLVLALATLVEPDGNDPAIDGVAAMVRPTTAREKQMVADAAKRLDEKVFKKDWHIDKFARDVSFPEALERLSGRPTVNIQGLVAGYQGPSGKTILPHQALAKLDIRLVPDMTAKGVIAALRAHLDKRGFQDIEVRDLGSYDPSSTPEDSAPVKAELAVYKQWGIDPILRPRSGGSWPGYLFTNKPLSLPAIHFGMGYGEGAHSRDEFYVVEPPRGSKVQGIGGAVRSFVDLLYAFDR
jgi:acetylornithine deacetylase/succinyl-diaminopimelate desuccinylase-like protein